MNLLKDKVVLLTGAAKGIGAGCAKAFAKNGASIIFIVDLDIEKAKDTAEEIRSTTKAKCYPIKADISKEEQIKSVFSNVNQKSSRLDILVNCAGICSTTDLFDLDIRQWDLTMNINLRGTFLFCREALRTMKKNHYGRVINFSSVAGQVGGIRTSADYSTSKAGILCLTKTLAKNAAKDGITVNSISPGLIDTDMTKLFETKVDEIPMGRFGSTEDVADVVLFLASDLSRYVTGACIDVNGGMYMN